MTKSHDEELVRKGAVKEAIKKLRQGDYGQIQEYLDNALEAIDSLPAVPQGKDCVEREAVKKWIQSELYRYHLDDDEDVEKLFTLISKDIDNLPPAVPASQALPAEIFVKHIRNHFKEEHPDWKVMCKICGKTIDQIYDEELLAKEAQDEKDTDNQR